MNLELPFVEVDPADLDPFLAEIDRALDALFLAEIDDALGHVDTDGRAAANGAAA